MKEYVYRDTKCLRDSKTGEPIRIYIPKDEIEKYNAIARNGYETGLRFKMGLQAAGIIL